MSKNEILKLEQELSRPLDIYGSPRDIEDIVKLQEMAKTLEYERRSIDALAESNSFYNFPLLILYFLIIAGVENAKKAKRAMNTIENIDKNQNEVQKRIFVLKLREYFNEAIIQDYIDSLWYWYEKDGNEIYKRGDIHLAFPFMMEYADLNLDEIPREVTKDRVKEVINHYVDYLKINFRESFEAGKAKLESIEAQKEEQKERKLPEMLEEMKTFYYENSLHKAIDDYHDENGVPDVKDGYYFFNGDKIKLTKAYLSRENGSIISDIANINRRIRNSDYSDIFRKFKFLEDLLENGIVSEGKDYKSKEDRYRELLESFKSFLEKEFKDLIEKERELYGPYIDEQISEAAFGKETILNSTYKFVFGDRDFEDRDNECVDLELLMKNQLLFGMFVSFYFPGDDKIYVDPHFRAYEKFIKDELYR